MKTFEITALVLISGNIIMAICLGNILAVIGWLSALTLLFGAIDKPPKDVL